MHKTIVLLKIVRYACISGITRSCTSADLRFVTIFLAVHMLLTLFAAALATISCFSAAAAAPFEAVHAQRVHGTTGLNEHLTINIELLMRTSTVLATSLPKHLNEREFTHHLRARMTVFVNQRGYAALLTPPPTTAQLPEPYATWVSTATKTWLNRHGQSLANLVKKRKEHYVSTTMTLDSASTALDVMLERKKMQQALSRFAQTVALDLAQRNHVLDKPQFQTVMSQVLSTMWKRQGLTGFYDTQVDNNTNGGGILAQYQQWIPETVKQWFRAHETNIMTAVLKSVQQPVEI